MLLSVAAVFLGLAIVFGILAFFRVAPQKSSGQRVPTAVTVTLTASAIPTSAVAGPTPVVTVTKIIDMPPPASGSGIGAIETGASTLGTVIAATCAVIALRPQDRNRPAMADPPVGNSAT